MGRRTHHSKKKKSSRHHHKKSRHDEDSDSDDIEEGYDNFDEAINEYNLTKEELMKGKLYPICYKKHEKKRRKEKAMMICYGVTGLILFIFVIIAYVMTADDLKASFNINKITNDNPLARVQSEYIVNEPSSSVTVDGSDSIDPDGLIEIPYVGRSACTKCIYYDWSISPSTGVTIISDNISMPYITGLTFSDSPYTLTLTVTDYEGASDTNTTIIRVNQQPIVNAGSDQLIHLPDDDQVLTPSSLSDPDGDSFEIEWTQIGVSPQVAKITKSGNSAIVSELIAGYYTFQLKATDEYGASNTDTVQVHVNTPPIVDAGSITNTQPISDLSLNGIVSDPDDGDSVVSTLWSFDEFFNHTTDNITAIASISNSASTTSTVTLSPKTAEGGYIFTLTATDTFGATTTAKTTLYHLPPNDYLSGVTLTSSPSTTNEPGDLITLGVSSPAITSSCLWYEVNVPDNSYTLNNEDTCTPTLTISNTGEYVFGALVYDNTGDVGTGIITLTSTAYPYCRADNISRSIDQYDLGNGTEIFILNGTSSYDKDGSINTYSWILNDFIYTGIDITDDIPLPSVTIADSSLSETTVTDITLEGYYQFQLTITDNDGQSTTCSQWLFIEEIPIIKLDDDFIPIEDDATNSNFAALVGGVGFAFFVILSLIAYLIMTWQKKKKERLHEAKVRMVLKVTGGDQNVNMKDEKEIARRMSVFEQKVQKTDAGIQRRLTRVVEEGGGNLAGLKHAKKDLKISSERRASIALPGLGKNGMMDLTEMNNNQLITWMENYDENDDGEIDLPEFHVLIKAIEKDIKEQEIIESFNLLDTDKSGAINTEEIIEILEILEGITK